MKKSIYTVAHDFRIEFYDVDSMQVAWHGNYVKYLELGRCALLDEIGYGYAAMSESGYLWPIVDMKIKYIQPLRFGQNVRVEASLLEYENRLRIGFEIYDKAGGELATTAVTTQMAVDARTGESQFVAPKCFIDRVSALLEENPS